MILAVVIGWILYALFDAWYQAYYYDLYPRDHKHPDLHWIFVGQRAILLASIFGVMEGRIFILNIGILCFALMFMYSFFHNTFYYFMRNRLNPYIYNRWYWCKSDTSDAKMEIGPGFRLAMFIFSLLLIYSITKTI